MYLKHLELHGFKTFADRTELEFTPGITAIVGPNGSGKSNIFDAIRWTLGEMSFRSLRSGRMDDIIFAGSAAKRAVGMAEVSLTINNDSGVLPVEFSEVTVTRRATRGGEGECFLNDTLCRLRDLQMLFLGTGLGGRSYSLIGQGQVDSILNADPEARRVLLEEAAGLARYKRRRREAERRLGHANANLLRVQDVLAELGSQLALLREQAQAATSYHAYTQELRELELALRVDETRRILHQLKRIQAQADGAQQRVRALATSAAEVGRSIDDSRARAEEVAVAWENGQRALLQIVEDLGSRESTAQILQERVRANAAQRERLMAEIQRLETHLQRTGEDRVGLRAQADALGGRRNTLLEDLEHAEGAQAAALEAQRLAEEHLAAARAEIADLATARTRALHDLARAEVRLATLTDEIAALTERRGALSAEADQVHSKREATERTLANLLGQQLEAEGQLLEIRERRRSLEARLAAIDEEDRRLAGDLQRIASTLAVLEDLERQLSGYEQGAREILLAKRAHPERFPGIRAPVLELLKVAPDHRPAIEAALGRRLFSLVAATVDDVKDGVAYLRNNGQGSVTFLPVELIVADHRPRTLPAGSDVVGRATDLVEPTHGAREVVEALLGDVVVVTSLDAAIALRRDGYGGRIATLKGEVLSPDGVISVQGRANGDATMLGRKEHIESLRHQRADLEARSNEVAADRRTQEVSLGSLMDAIADLEALVARSKAAIAEQQAALSLVQAEGSRLTEDRREVDAQFERAEAEHQQLEVSVARLHADEAVITRARGDQEHGIQVLESEVRALADAVTGAGARVTELRVQLAELTGSLEALRTRTEERTQEEADLDTRRGQVQAEVAALQGERQVLEQALEAARADHHALIERQEATRHELASLETERSALHQARVDLEARWRETQDSLREHEEQVHRLEVRQAQVETELAAGQRRIVEEFGLAWEAVAEVRLPVSRDEALGRVEALRGLIAALGAVNLRALEEHQTVAARVEVLHTQTEDLQRARKALNALMHRLDKVLQVRFAETFAAVNEEFNRLFVRLFEGGGAKLILVETEPGAEPGVDIEAQLPGKKMRRLSAFSGGERVLVALALIFAMLRVHPSPFCIFDEVEAALDDANTKKFTLLLRELAEQTQVIIVTHNKGTMEAADVLYGVTMEVPGVSKIISMRLAHKDVQEPVAVA